MLDYVMKNYVIEKCYEIHGGSCSQHWLSWYLSTSTFHLLIKNHITMEQNIDLDGESLGPGPHTFDHVKVHSVLRDPVFNRKTDSPPSSP